MDFSLLIFGIIVIAILAPMLRHRGPTAVQRMRAEYDQVREEVRTMHADALARSQAQHAAFLRDLDADMATYRRRQRRVGFFPEHPHHDSPKPGCHAVYDDASDPPSWYDSQPQYAQERDDDWDPAYAHHHNLYGPFIPPGHVSDGLADSADVRSLSTMTQLHDRASHHDF